MVNGTGVNKEREELYAIRNRYALIEDALSGESAVKARTTTYLPTPNDVSGSAADRTARYDAYILRAVYYNMVKPTQDALVGQLFLRPPKVTLPDSMAAMENDVNGEGLGIEQLIRRAANHVLPYGRCGFLADFPRTDGAVTQADVNAGVRPIVRFFEPWNIINWQTRKVANECKLTLLVLREALEVALPSNEFDVEVEHRFRVYRLTGNAVTVEVWADDEVVEAERPVVDSKGVALTEIPFQFVGSENNDAEMDEPPLYSMAVMNIAHYRNSADYEESVFLVGQPTPVYAGLTADWVENYFESGIPFGSRASIPLPENATAQLLQAMPNTLAFEAMTHKEQQMIAIGARLINPKATVERKEKEIQIEAASQRSVLTTIKDNLEKGFVDCLKKAALFVDASEDEIELELNDNFDLTALTGDEIRSITELYTARLTSFKAVHENLRRSGIVKDTADEAQAEILADMAFRKQVEPVEPTANPNSKLKEKNNA